MKFDIILLNPPYLKNLHLKILKHTLSFKKKEGVVICLHPLTSFISNILTFNPKNLKTFKIIKSIINQCERIIELKDFNNFFQNRLLQGAGGITVWKNTQDEEVRIDKFVNITDFEKNLFKKIMAKVKENNLLQWRINIDNKKFQQGDFIINIPIIHGTISEGDYNLLAKTYEKALELKEHKFTKKFAIIQIKFKSDRERFNFYKSLNCSFMHYITAIWKTNTRVYSQYIPWLENYSEEWTNEKFYKYFNLTKNEIEFIENKIKERGY